MLLGALVMTALMAIFGRRSPEWIQRHFSKLQLLSAGAYSLGHGGNDAQKTMGIIVTALIATHHLVPGAHGKAPVPLWVVLSCHVAMALGTSLGGWRIVRTMGTRITKLTPADGFAAESAGAAALFLTTSLGIPVSTTHTIAGGITGTGVVRRLNRIRWPVAKPPKGVFLCISGNIRAGEKLRYESANNRRTFRRCRQPLPRRVEILGPSRNDACACATTTPIRDHPVAGTSATRDGRSRFERVEERPARGPFRLRHKRSNRSSS
jgi:Phosphate transporter family